MSEISVCFFFFKQKTAYDMRISDWSSDVCSSDLGLYKALRTAGVVRLLDEPDKYGRFVEVDHDLQDDFALNQLLAPFLLHAVPLLDRDDEGYQIGRASCRERVCQYV